MKRLKIIYLITMVAIVIMACSNESENRQSKIKKSELTSEEVMLTKDKIKCISSEDKKIYNYSADSVKEFTNWIMNSESKKGSNGAFEKIIELYRGECKKLIVPIVNGNEAMRVFVDSNTNTINYVFETPAIRVCIEPMETKENIKYRKSNIRNFMIDKYQIKLNHKETNGHNEQNNQGYEYNKILFQCDEVKIGIKNKNCVVGYMYSEKSSMQHIVNFIEKNVLVRIIYFDDKKELDLKGIEQLSFQKVNLQ